VNALLAFVLRLAAGRAMQIMAYGREAPGNVSGWPKVLAFPAHRDMCRAADEIEAGGVALFTVDQSRRPA
jgi:hypothetical protein